MTGAWLAGLLGNGWSRLLAGVAAFGMVLWAAFRVGRLREAGRIEARRLAQALDREMTRNRIEESLHDETDLLGRARRSGLLRKGP